MFSNNVNQNFATDQINLINSLKNKLANDQTLVQNITPIHTKYLRSGGDVADNMMAMRNYICHCGSTTETVEHTTSITSLKVTDNYLMNCTGCGTDERVSFQMLRSALATKPKQSNFVTQKRSQVYPYI
ncbi:MAG: hypothetical protein IH840_02370 [Candidatus Heimdallarchaeota archaeon]|nr:hypothetical protein [Candidatus Heimdallarchaeota archaeon]